MRTLCYQTVIGLIILTLANSANAELIGGCFDDVIVTNELTTSVKFRQQKLANYQESDNLKLRVMDGNDGNKVIREDAILKKDGDWVWNKILPFSEKLKFLILKDNKSVCTEYRTDTKSTLAFSSSNSIHPIRSVVTLSDIPMTNNKEKKRLPIDTKELNNCKDKVLVVVFDKETNVLLWQYYGELKNDLVSEPIELSKNVEGKIVMDEDSCGK